MLILQILKKDIEFFSKNGLMDYSLLFGVEKIHKRESNRSNNEKT